MVTLYACLDFGRRSRERCRPDPKIDISKTQFKVDRKCITYTVTRSYMFDFLGVIGFLFCRSFAFGPTCDIGKHQCGNGYMYYVASHSPAYSLVASKQGHALGAKSRWPYMRALG